MWPKPMEGLDLFNPLNTIESDSSSSEEEEGDEEVEEIVRNNYSSLSSDHESDDDYVLEGNRMRMIKPKAVVAKPKNTNLLLTLSPKVPASLGNGTQHEANGTSTVGDFQVQKVCVYGLSTRLHFC